MNSLAKIVKNSTLTKLALQHSTRSITQWNKDWMPGPYPTTPEERAAAAKKYNLLPEEYEPDPDGFGDYPKLPAVSGFSKDNYRDWDFPQIKKDYGETMHTMANLISEDRWDINQAENEKIHPGIQVAMCYGVFLTLFLICYWFEDKKISLPHMKQHFPADGVHYKYP